MVLRLCSRSGQGTDSITVKAGMTARRFHPLGSIYSYCLRSPTFSFPSLLLLSYTLQVKEHPTPLHLNYFSFTTLLPTTDRFPTINSLIHKINLRKRRDSFILGGVIGVCTILLLLYTFHWLSLTLHKEWEILVKKKSVFSVYIYYFNVLRPDFINFLFIHFLQWFLKGCVVQEMETIWSLAASLINGCCNYNPLYDRCYKCVKYIM